MTELVTTSNSLAQPVEETVNVVSLFAQPMEFAQAVCSTSWFLLLVVTPVVRRGVRRNHATRACFGNWPSRSLSGTRQGLLIQVRFQCECLSLVDFGDVCHDQFAGTVGVTRVLCQQ